jgi:uncharacterized membrane protein
MEAQDFFTKEQHENIRAAIRKAETQTSGEIRLFIENRCKEEILDRAAFIFDQLNIHKTTDRNGVLFYLAIHERQFAILGDAGINKVVKQGFWDEIKEHMVARFKKAEFAEGLCEGISMAGEALKNYFPYRKNDKNELSDDIVFGKQS